MAYSDKETARLKEFDSVTYDQAVALGVELGKSTKSVISKVQSLEIPYIRKPVPAKRPTPETKAQIVAQIEEATGDLDLSGLVGATLPALAALRDFVTA